MQNTLQEFFLHRKEPPLKIFPVHLFMVSLLKIGEYATFIPLFKNGRLTQW